MGCGCCYPYLGSFGNIFALIVTTLLLNGKVAFSENLFGARTKWIPDNKVATCSTNDLNHSPLIECPLSDRCSLLSGNITSIWPQDHHQIVHMYSSRSGDRFKFSFLKNLKYRQNEEEALYNINTSLIVDSESKLHNLSGFGATLEPQKLMSNKNYRPIFRDIFSDGQFGLQLSFLVLRLDRDYVAMLNLAHVLKEIDTMIGNSMIREQSSSKLKTIFSIEGLMKTQDIIATIKGIWDALSSSNHLECWAITIDKEWLFSNSDSSLFLADIRDLFSSKNLLSVTNFKDSTGVIDVISKEKNSLNGLIIKSDFSSPYNILSYARNFSEKFVIMSMGASKPATHDYGDWNNAKNLIAEIINHITYGSNGFIIPISSKDILIDSKDKDAPIYEAPGGYFRGPMYYALGHFSLFLTNGSRLLNSRVETSPNMFAAKYISFLTPKNDHVVSIVMNDNPHHLPFQLVIDNLIVTQLDIEPKSLNTFVTRIS